MRDQKRRFPVPWLGVLVLLGSAAAAPGQTIVVTAKSVNELAEDVEHAIVTIAPPGDPGAQAARDHLEKFKSGDLIKGLDKARGFALAVTLPRDFPQGGSPSVVAAVPVSDLGQFLDSLKGFGFAVDDQPGAEGFSHKVSAPNGNFGLFVLQSRGYALFSLVPQGADQLKTLDPTAWTKKGRLGADLSVRIQLGEIPDALKDQVVNQMEAQAAQQRDRKPNEKDAEYKARLAGQDLVYEGFKTLLKDGESLSLDLDLDRKTSEMAVELAMTARPGTAMAGSLRDLNGRRSRFEGLGRDAALGFWVNLPLVRPLRDALADGFDQGLKDGLEQVKSEEQKQLLGRFAELVKSNLAAPEIDLGMAIRRSTPVGRGDPHFVLVSGMRLKDGREFERLVREAAAKVKAEDGYKVAFDVAQAKDGTAIHEMSGPIKDANPEMVRQFGKATLAFAFRADSILAAFGEGSTGAVKRALDDAAATPAGKSDGPAAISLHMAALGDIAEKNQEALKRATAEIYKGDGPKRDRMFLGLTGEGDGIRLRAAVDLIALKLAIMVERERKK